MKGKGPKKAPSARAKPLIQRCAANDNAPRPALTCRHEDCNKPIVGPHLIGHVEGWARTPVACSPSCAEAVSAKLFADDKQVLRWIWKGALRAAV